MHPFAELTNRTPSPSQKDECNYSRKHSPWTAARQKKKTRPAGQPQPGDTLPVLQQVIPEAFHSPATKTVTGVSAEYSLADGLPSGSQTTASPHSSPPVSKGSAEDADVHPSKAYLPDPQERNSPHDMELGSAGGFSLAGAPAGPAAGAAPRSPVWFCSSTLHDAMSSLAAGAAADGSAQGALQVCSNGPTTGNLCERFDQVAQQRHHSQLDQQPHHHHHQQQQQQSYQEVPQQQHSAAVPPAHPQGAAPIRGRRLTARRGNWAGSEPLHRTHAAGNTDVSQLAASRSCRADQEGTSSRSDGPCDTTDVPDGLSWQQQQQPASLHQLMGSHTTAQQSCDAEGLVYSDSGFRLHNRLNFMDGGSIQSRRRSFGSVFLQRWPCMREEGGVDDWCGAGVVTAQAAGGSRGAVPVAGDGEEEATLGWYETQMQEAADDGDLTAAQQLWSSLQASGLKPSRRFMHYFLMCCQYAGADPADAEDAVREMCTAAELEPDSLTARLLAAIDIGWQQLQWGV